MRDVLNLCSEHPGSLPFQRPLPPIPAMHFLFNYKLRCYYVWTTSITDSSGIFGNGYFKPRILLYFSSKRLSSLFRNSMVL